jgi:hypothetical protein
LYSFSQHIPVNIGNAQRKGTSLTIRALAFANKVIVCGTTELYPLMLRSEIFEFRNRIAMVTYLKCQPPWITPSFEVKLHRPAEHWTDDTPGNWYAPLGPWGNAIKCFWAEIKMV